MKPSPFIASWLAAVALASLSVPAASVELIMPDGASFAVPGRSLRVLNFRTTIRQRYDFSCGSAALATLLTYHYEHGTDEAAVLLAMFRVGDQRLIRREGFSMLDMKRYLSAAGFAADGFQITLARLAEAGVPAIALLDRDGYRHFVVIKGVTRDRVLIGDPSRGTRTVDRHDFEGHYTGILLLIRDSADVGARHFNDVAEWRVSGAIPMDLALPRDVLQWRVVAPTDGL